MESDDEFTFLPWPLVADSNKKTGFYRAKLNSNYLRNVFMGGAIEFCSHEQAVFDRH